MSGLTAISGVAVIATSSMPLLRDFGIVVGMNVAVALLSALVFLPPMLVWADSDGRNWVSRHLVPDSSLTTRDGAVTPPACPPANPSADDRLVAEMYWSRPGSGMSWRFDHQGGA